MKALLRYGVLAAGLAAAGLGCNKKDDGVTAAGEQAQSLQEREVIAYIPQDTPYLLWADALPTGYADNFLPLWHQEIKPIFEEKLQHREQMEPAMVQLFEDLIRLQSSADFEALGFSFAAPVTAYGLGIFPVIRVGLKDEAKARAFVKRIETALSKKPWPAKKLGEQEYFVPRAKVNVALTVAFVKGELVLALLPTEMEERLMKIVLLQEKPQNSFAQMNALRDLAQSHGIRGLLGYVDNRALGDILMSRAQGLNGEIWNAIRAEFELPTSDVCYQEISQMLAKMPRFLWGLNRMSDHRTDSVFALELEPNLAKMLTSLATDGYGMAPEGTRASFSLGVNMKKVYELLKATAAAIHAAPFQCEWLKEVNKLAEELDEAMAQSKVWPQIQPFMGLSAGIDQLEPPKEGSQEGLKLSAYAAVLHENPQALANMANGMAALTLPGFKPLELKQGELVDVTFPLLATLGLPVTQTPKVMLDAKGIGVALGSEARLKALFQTKAEPGTVMAFGYDGEWLARALQNYLTIAGEVPPKIADHFLLGLQSAKKSSFRMMLTPKGVVMKQTDEYR